MASLYYQRTTNDAVAKRILLVNISARHAAHRMAQLKVAAKQRGMDYAPMIASGWLNGGIVMHIKTCGLRPNQSLIPW